MPRNLAPPPSLWPEGFRYQPNFLSAHEESALLGLIERMPFEVFDFRGYKALRRIVEYGYEYDFGSRQASAAPPIPESLLPLRARAAQFAGVAPARIIEAVVTEYPPGAPIGWHRDVPQFELVIGISVAAPARLRLKPYKQAGKIISVILEPRSIYLLSGPARWAYQHSIPAQEKLRYSVTFRTLREKKQDRVA